VATKVVSDKSAKPVKGHRKLWVSLAIVLIIAIALLYLYESYGSLPSSVVQALSSGKQLNSTVLQNIVLQKVNSSNTFAVSYSGQITIKKDPPISFSYAKYYNDTRITLSVDNVTPFGNLSAVLITKKLSQNGTLCIKADKNSVFNIIQSGNVTDGYKCVQTYNGSAHEELLSIANSFVNVSSLANIATKSYGLSLYNGQPCYSISGSGTIKVNSTLVDVSSPAQTPVAIQFDACLSGQYNIPLTLSANMTAPNGSSIKISLNESSVNEAATADQVDSLP
jgi:multidrug transporter EmrE-like cation transporter